MTGEDLERDDAPTLPGLEPARAGIGEVERAARASIAALGDQVEPRKAVVVQTLVTVARQIDRAVNSAKAKDYAVANLVAQLRETFAVLEPQTGGDLDAFDQLASELRDAAMAERERRSSAVRDPAES